MLFKFKNKSAQTALRTYPELGGQKSVDMGVGGRESPSWVPEAHQAQGDWFWAGLPPSPSVHLQIKVQTNFISTALFNFKLRAALPC